jgi:hypothetical protein
MTLKGPLQLQQAGASESGTQSADSGVKGIEGIGLGGAHSLILTVLHDWSGWTIVVLHE